MVAHKVTRTRGLKNLFLVCPLSPKNHLSFLSFLPLARTVWEETKNEKKKGKQESPPSSTFGDKQTTSIQKPKVKKMSVGLVVVISKKTNRKTRKTTRFLDVVLLGAPPPPPPGEFRVDAVQRTRR